MKCLFRFVLVFAVFSFTGANANAATISLRTEIINPVASGTTNGDWYEILFGTTNNFRLDFQFSSLTPTSTSSDAGNSTASYDLERVDISGSNGRIYSFYTNPLQIGILGGSDTNYLSTFSNDRLIFTDSYLAPNDSSVILDDFKFTFLPNELVDGGFPDTSLSAFYFLNNVVTPFEQGFSVFANTQYFPNGDGADINARFDLNFGNYSVISDVSNVPLPAALPLFFIGLAALFGFLWRKNSIVAAS